MLLDCTASMMMLFALMTKDMLLLRVPAILSNIAFNRHGRPPGALFASDLSEIYSAAGRRRSEYLRSLVLGFLSRRAKG
jgi:hypothetical protein